jgi:hypothetical protein
MFSVLFSLLEEETNLLTLFGHDHGELWHSIRSNNVGIPFPKYADQLISRGGVASLRLIIVTMPGGLEERRKIIVKRIF